jgi:hypothetical protein
MTEGQRLLRFINQNIERFVEVFDRVIPREPMKTPTLRDDGSTLQGNEYDLRGGDERVDEKVGRCFGHNSPDLAQLQEWAVRLARLSNTLPPFGDTMRRRGWIRDWVMDNFEALTPFFSGVTGIRRKSRYGNGSEAEKVKEAIRVLGSTDNRAWRSVCVVFGRELKKWETVVS